LTTHLLPHLHLPAKRRDNIDPLFHSTAVKRLSPASIRFAANSSTSAHTATPTGCSPF
jgi:hypothetical protein